MGYLRFKRFLDIVFSIVLIIGLSWLGVLIVFGYVVTFQFPIFFYQDRIGMDEKIFRLIKFRSLKDSGETLQSRKFFWGNILRRSSLDELPQLWNVLKGEMSMIGPRPLPVQYLPLFSEEQRLRHSVRPGITGLAQVKGRHGISWQEKFSFDVYYIEHISFMLDAEIVFRTIKLLLSFKKDISMEEKPFTGQ